MIEMSISFSFPDKTECPELDGTFADPQRVTGYLVCSGGISTRMNCTKGLVWRDDKNSCDTPGKCTLRGSYDTDYIPRNLNSGYNNIQLTAQLYCYSR